MPRRGRKAADPASTEQAIAQRVQAVYKKLLPALQDQRDLRCDLSSTRTRALLLDSEYVVLHAEYERALVARDKLEALSRELARQNKRIDEESEKRVREEKRLREEIVHRFNAAMMEINKKLARQSCSREQREQYVSTLQQKLADLGERYEMRRMHFEQQVHRKRLEKRLAEARTREVERKKRIVEEELRGIRGGLQNAREEFEELEGRVEQCNEVIREGENMLKESQDSFEGQRAEIEAAQQEAKRMQTRNAQLRRQNSSAGVHLKAMEVEYERLRGVVEQERERERKERLKAEMLDRLCKQVTCERAEHHGEIVVMQDAWSNLKQEIALLKEQVGDSNRVFEVLQNLMAREPFESIEDVINEKLARLRLATGGPEVRGEAAGRSSGAQKVDPPG